VAEALQHKLGQQASKRLMGRASFIAARNPPTPGRPSRAMLGQNTCSFESSNSRNCPDRTPQAQMHVKAAPIAMPARNRQSVMVNMR
jgi:hypothetical protein